jgi:predicted nicotinamide N-methyase
MDSQAHAPSPSLKAAPPGERPPMPETPPEAVTETVREHVLIEDRDFVIRRPAASDKLLDHPAVRAAFAVDEYMPYWADLWPAARMLAKAVLREPWPVPPSGERLHALEIGCGLGLAGVAALAAGLRVTFSDYDATALRFAAENAHLNGLNDCNTLQMDWRYPPPDLRVPVVLASDLVYEMRNIEPLVALVRHVLAPGGLCLITDQDRVPSHFLREALRDAGLSYETQTVRAGEPGGRRLKGTLYRINRPARAAGPSD